MLVPVYTSYDTSKLRQRLEGLSAIESHFDASLNELINTYSGQCFKNTAVEKDKFFRECLELNLAPESVDLVSERCKLPFHRDMRSSVEYGLDLAFGWLSEDLVLQWLRGLGSQVSLSGRDKFREFLNSNEIGTESDFQIIRNGETRNLEIVFSWNNYWKRSNKLDLRDSKYRSLSKAGQESLCLGIEVPDLSGFLLDFRKDKEAFVTRSNPAWGGKKCFTMDNVSSRQKHLYEIAALFQ
jgi:hypothetical protein